VPHRGPGVQVFHFFRGLPKEEIWTDRRAEDANDHGGGIEVEGEFRPHGAQRHFRPGNIYGEKDGGIGQQRKRQPFQEKDVSVIRHENLKQKRYSHKNRGHEVAIGAADQFCDLSHGRDIGRDIQRIGDQQQHDHALEDDGRKRGLDIGSQPFAGDPSDLRAHRLDRGHQRVRHWHCPEHVEAELGARLGVGRNTAWIVVNRAGYKPGTEPRQRMLFDAAPKDCQRSRLLRSFVALPRRPHGASLCFCGKHDQVSSPTGLTAVHLLRQPQITYHAGEGSVDSNASLIFSAIMIVGMLVFAVGNRGMTDASAT
jgi:hypothetical protein